jgi:hypothetical protein
MSKIFQIESLQFKLLYFSFYNLNYLQIFKNLMY